MVIFIVIYSVLLFLSFTFHTQWPDHTHKLADLCTYRSVWSLLIIRGYPHGRQMALLIFQTDTAFWYLIWWLHCVCVRACACVCPHPCVWFPRKNSIMCPQMSTVDSLYVCVCVCVCVFSLLLSVTYFTFAVWMCQYSCHHVTVVDSWSMVDQDCYDKSFCLFYWSRISHASASWVYKWINVDIYLIFLGPYTFVGWKGRDRSGVLKNRSFWSKAQGDTHDYRIISATALPLF